MTSQNKVVRMGTFMVMIMSIISYVLLFIAQFTIGQSTINNSNVIVG